MNLLDICFDAYEQKDLNAFEELTKKNSVAVFVYNKHVYKSGDVFDIDKENYRVRPEFRKGVLLAPVSVFEHINGGRVEKNTLFVGENRLEYTVGKKVCAKNGESLEFSTAPFSRFGHDYLPLIEAARALGLGAVGLYENRLCVLGDAATIDTLAAEARKNPAIEFAGGAAVVGEYDTERFTSEDFKIAKDKWRELLVSTPEKMDLTDPVLAEKIREINDSAKPIWESMHKEPSRKMLWGSEPPSESCHLSEHYGNIYNLARAWGTYGGELYHSEELKSDILDALEWMYENMYGEAEIEGRGWRDINTFNWWNWYVDAPRWLTNAMLIMEEFLTREQKQKYLKLFEYVVDRWRTGESQDHCSGRLEVAPKCALLLEDKKRLAKCARDYHIMLKVGLAGAGTHTDYVNYQHGFPLSMMYGLVNLTRVLKTASNLAGTPLEFSSPRAYTLLKIQKLMYEAAMYRGRGFSCLYGRGCTGSENYPGLQVITEVLPMIGFFGIEEDEYVRHFVKYSLSTEEQIEMAKTGCSLGNYAALKSILDDDTISKENDYECAHAYFTADRATLHKNDFAFCVSMPSYRHQNYECINNGNKTGWYTNDGALYVYTKTDPHEFDGPNFVLNERLAHRIPGTTTDNKKRAAVSIGGGKSWKPTQDRVGCMAHDGKYVIAGMDYECYNREEADEVVDTGYGGGLPKFISDLKAKKAYFMFGDKCVCLGAGISSAKDDGVNTTVEHRRLVKCEKINTGADLITVNGEKMPDEPFDKSFDDPRFARVEGFSGFVFLDAPKLSVSKYMYEIPEDTWGMHSVIPDYAKGERPFVEMMIDHGKNPDNATYAYVVMPYASDESLKAYSENPSVEILSNTEKCQAVVEKTLGVTGIVFYEAGKCAGIKADRPCLVTYSEENGEFKISICEPTNKTDEVRIEILRPLKLKASDRRYTVECGKTTRIKLDAALSVGEAYRATFAE